MGLMTGKLILGVTSGLADFVKKHWRNIVTIDLTRKEKEVDVIGKAAGVRQKDRMQSLKAAEELRALYKKMGLSNKEIREKLEPLIREANDPLSVIARLAQQGKVKLLSNEVITNQDRPALPDDRETE